MTLCQLEVDFLLGCTKIDQQSMGTGLVPYVLVTLKYTFQAIVCTGTIEKILPNSAELYQFWVFLHLKNLVTLKIIIYFLMFHFFFNVP